MMRVLTIGCAALAVFVAVPTLAQDDPVAKALLGAPTNLREGATVIQWKPDYTYDTLKQGTSKLVCYDRSGTPLQQPFSIECTHVGNLPRVAQNMKFESVGNRAQANVALEAAEKDGTRVKPEFGSVFYNLSGPDRAQARPHMTVAVPGATLQTLGLPENPNSGGAWIMNAGTSTAHIMIPGQ